MYILTKLSHLVIAAAMSLGIVSMPVQQAPVNLGAAVPSTPALYDGYLSSNISTTDNSMTITPSTLRNGQTLSGYLCFVIDVNQPTVEYVCGQAAGSAITGMSRGVDLSNPTTTSATLAFTHRRFASVSVSDYPTIQLLTQKLNGADNLDAPLSYSFASTSLNRPGHLVDKDYVDSLAFNGAAVVNANTASKGLVQIATTLQSASSTATGSTGATLVIPASSATSTYNAATAGLKVVVTNNAGQIDPNFLSGTTLASSTRFTNGIQLLQIGKNFFWATTSQSWVVPSGVTYVDVQCVGGGGGGGATASVTSNSIGGGGAGGGYARTVANLTGTSSVFISIGGPGIGGAAASGGNTGTFGGNTTFGPFLTANGGGPGVTMQNNGSGILTNGGNGGAASTTLSTGFMSIAGGQGIGGFVAIPTNAILAMSGAGGDSVWGQGGIASFAATTNHGAGAVGNGYGGGGGGAVSSNSSNTDAGGNGTGGACLLIY